MFASVNHVLPDIFDKMTRKCSTIVSGFHSFLNNFHININFAAAFAHARGNRCDQSPFGLEFEAPEVFLSHARPVGIKEVILTIKLFSIDFLTKFYYSNRRSI